MVEPADLIFISIAGYSEYKATVELISIIVLTLDLTISNRYETYNT